MFELFLLPWWCFAAALFVILLDILFLTTNKNGLATFVTIVSSGALLYFATGINLLQVIKANPVDAFLYVNAYFVVGGMWSLLKWYIYLVEERDNLRIKVKKWDKQCGPGSGNNRAGNSRPVRGYETYAKNNKSKILSWIGHWPISVVQTFIGDFLLRLTKHVFRMLSGIYESIGNTLFKEFN